MEIHRMQSKQDLLMESLSNFYKKEDNIEKVLPIINKQTKISLRILDWFVTNYARKYDVEYDVSDNCGNTKKYSVYLEYKAQLKAYSKKQFDPFCRRERISFIYKKGHELETTVGQLNFFRWIVQNGVIDYVNDHIETIEEDMNKSAQYLEILKKDSNGTKRVRTKRKDRNIKISATKIETKKNTTILVQF